MAHFLSKLRSLPEDQKKVIIFAVVIMAALVLGFFWIKSTGNNLSKLQSVNLPKIEVPQDVTDSLSKIQQDVTGDSSQAVVPDDPTKDWQMYTNAQYGFEIKYPKEWIVQQNTKSKEYSLIFCLDNPDGCKGKRLTEVNKNEDGPIYLFTSKKGNAKPTDPSNYYLGTDASETDYYLFSEFPNNASVAHDMISTFKFANTTN